MATSLASELASLLTQHGDSSEQGATPSPGPQPDPFWNNTPRTTHAETQSLTAAIREASQPASGTSQPLALVTKVRRKSIARRAQCTHMTIKRIYGGHKCGLCGGYPSIGWIYACQQDQDLTQDPPDPDASFTVRDDISYLEVQACHAESLAMKQDVVRGIRQGSYTDEQVAKLIGQRQRVLELVRRTTRPSNESTSSIAANSATAGAAAHQFGSHSPTSSSDLPMSPAGTPTNTPADSTPGTPLNTKPPTNPQKSNGCTFQCCHTCRPFFQDRLFMSFEQVLGGGIPAVTEEEITGMPLMNARIVRNVGLRPVPFVGSPGAEDLGSFSRDRFDYDDEVSTSDWTPTTLTVTEDSESSASSRRRSSALGNEQSAVSSPLSSQVLLPESSRYPLYMPAADDAPKAGAHARHAFTANGDVRTVGHQPDAQQISSTGPYVEYDPFPTMATYRRAWSSSMAASPSTTTLYDDTSRFSCNDEPHTPGAASSTTASSISLPTPATILLNGPKDLLYHEDTFHDASAFESEGSLGLDGTHASPLQVAVRGQSQAPKRRRRQSVVFPRASSTSGRRQKRCGETNRSGQTRASTPSGSEVEVQGGVALTEESIETGMPDVLTEW